MTRILCVEDNPQNMRLVRKILQHQDYEVLEAEDGQTGVRLAKEQKPDLILMDINLPDIDGLQATGIIKGDDATKHIPIVALTANAMYGDEERCLAAGCDGYISKPVSKSKLVSVVEDFLAQADDTAASDDTATDEATAADEETDTDTDDTASADAETDATPAATDDTSESVKSPTSKDYQPYRDFSPARTDD